MQFPPPFSWLALLWAIYLDPQCKIFLCTVSSYYSRINRDRFHVKRQQERESFIAKAVQRFSPVLRHGDNRALLLTLGFLEVPWAPTLCQRVVKMQGAVPHHGPAAWEATLGCFRDSQRGTSIASTASRQQTHGPQTPKIKICVPRDGKLLTSSIHMGFGAPSWW